MSVSAAELKWYRSKTVTNTAANGGALSKDQIVTDVRGNVFPDVSQAEREAGITRYRKRFIKVASVTNDILYNSKVYLTTVTPADDYVSIFAGTQMDTQNDIDEYVVEYGVGTLDTNVAAGENVLAVVLENEDLDIFRDGDTIWIGDDTNEEYHENVTVSKTGDVVTITLEAGDQLSNSYLSSNTFVSSCLLLGDIEPDVEDWAESSASGTYDETTYPVIVSNIGGIYEDWTITFTSASNFNCSGAGVGAVAVGNINNNYSPTNPDFTQPYFTLNKNGFGGTWDTGNTIQFRTIPAAKGIWFKQVVPAGSVSYSGNNFNFRIVGESA